MTEVSVELLFDEFATRYLRGERPDVGEYLAQAGEEREELGRLVDRFLAAVPAREPSEEEVVLMQARVEQQPPILVLRLRRALRRDAIVRSLVGRLGLDAAASGKVDRYYHDLEVGRLDPEGVDRRVWDVLADLLGANVRRLATLRPEPPHEVAFYRPMNQPELAARLDAATAAPGEPDAPDEVDMLFTGSA